MKTANFMGIFRVILHTQVVKNFLRWYKAKSLTRQLNRVYAKQDSSLDEDLLQSQYELISKVEWCTGRNTEN
jgi:hypothetical protein